MRIVFVVSMGVRYATSKNPLLPVLVGIIGFGMLLTTAGIVADRRRERA